MVKIAIAGGSSAVAQPIINAIVATNKHELVIMSRKESSARDATSGITYIKADYHNKEQLVKILQGVHTVMSFITTQSDPENVAQRNLIDVSVQVGVKRFAPSEWGSSSFEHMRWYDGKAEIREYLKELNKNKKVLEYTLFQPGLLMDYLAYPYQSATDMRPNALSIDFNNRRAIILEGSEDSTITWTSSEDHANVVSRALEYDGEWPVIGGVKGSDVTLREIIALGEKIRGGTFKVEKLKAEDLKAGIVKSSWIPKVDHPAIPPEKVEKVAPIALASTILSFSAGAWAVSDEWNQLLPDYKFVQAEEFLENAWKGKP